MSNMTHLDQQGNPRMVDVGTKGVTTREATAEGWLDMPPELLEQLVRQGSPKGDLIKIAEVAGIAAAKRTPDLIPLCHPLMLEHLSVIAELKAPRGLYLRCTARTTGKTGVEMEALTGVTGAALAAYDLCKALHKGAVISDVKLLEKSGGASGHWKAPQQDNPEETTSQGCLTEQRPRTAVITLSDRCYRGETEDSSGPALVEELTQQGAVVDQYLLLPDEPELLARHLTKLADQGFKLIVTTGGTGIGPRDRTPEAMKSIADFEVPGFGELMRLDTRRFTERSVLSRNLAVVRGTTLMVALPGSEKASRQCVQALFPVLGHSIDMLKGRYH